jgi:hypothetical protein
MAGSLLVLACLVPLWWPGDSPFINDEPILIAAAVSANRAGVLASAGLLGTYGFTYGPLPTWVYQALVAITGDLVTLVWLHTLLMVVTTAGALWWLSRSLNLWAWFAPVPLLSPYVWFYARVLWDNPFLIPLGALAVAAYAAHLSSGSATGLRVVVAALLAMPLVHLMSLALVIPLGVHLLAYRWRALWAHRLSAAAIVSCYAVLAWPYWTYLSTARSPESPATWRLDGWLFPLLGGRFLSARELAYFYGPGPVDGAAFSAAATLSWLGYALVWGGLGVAIWNVVHACRARHWTPRTHVTLILLASVICQAVISGISARFEHPHYLNGTWIAFVLLAWLTVDCIACVRSRVRWSAPLVTGVLAISLLASVGMLAVRLHRSGGTRDIYGPTIANQQQLARALAVYAPQSPLQIDVTHYRRFPHTLQILRQLNARTRSDGPERPLVIRYVSKDPRKGAIGLIAR